jgi:hypothetical protein
MRRSILATVLALSAQAVWAQEATDPVLPDGSETVTETADTTQTEATESETQTEATTETEVTTETETTPVEETGTEGEVIEETETVDDEGTDVVVDTPEEPVVSTESRSPTGQFHGGHHGSVSTLARAGLGPVFGKLRSQGYGDIQIEQVGDEITIEAFSRDGQMRRLTYDATTGALLSDEQGQPNLMQSIANTFRKDRAAGTAKTRDSQKSKAAASTGKTKDFTGSNGRGNGSGGSKDSGSEAKSGGNGNGNGGGQGGGGKGNGGGQSSGNGQGGGNGNGNGNGGGRNK